MSTNTKKNMYYIIILILTLLIFVVAATFAYFSMSASKRENSTQIYTGTVAINYIQGNLIQGNNIMPAVNAINGLSEPPFNATNNVYKNTFSISNSGTLDVKLSIDLNISNNDFYDGVLKYIIYCSNEINSDTGIKIGEGSLNKTGVQELKINKLYSTLKSNVNKAYTVMIWLNETGDNQNKEQGKNFLASLSVEAIQANN